MVNAFSCLLPLICLAALAAPAQGASGAWDRAWGGDVITGGDFGFEICTVAANCKAGLANASAGELNFPGGIATDAAGNVYVGDRSNLRIQKFDSAGNFERAWGKDVRLSGGTDFEICTVAADCKGGVTGTLGGELARPESVAADAAGNVYVADSFNDRIQMFDSDGNFQRTWGKDVLTGGGTNLEVCELAANCKAGVIGTGNGEFDDPVGVGTEPGGEVYVADRGNHRIQRFDPTASALNTFQGARGSLGGQGLQFSSPRGVATDAAGNVYVGDQGNARIQRFDSAGNFQRAWGRDVLIGGSTDFEICTVALNCQSGATGGLGGELNFPIGMATDATGSVYVADALNFRIQRFDSAGNFQRTWGKDVITGGGTGFEICTVAASCKMGSTGGLGGELQAPEGVAADAAGNLYVADSANARIQKFVDPPAPPPPAGGSPTTPIATTPIAGPLATVTGQRAAALKKCKKKKKKSKKARKKCKKRARKLPL
ncbi:MAG: hypothetical protein ACRDL6_09155 [Solirubrobacterales bacterium]